MKRFLELVLSVLFIQFRPILGVVPEITNHPTSTTVVRGEPVTLECRATGNSLIEWYKDGRILENGEDTSHRLSLPDGSLFFLHVVHSKRETDSGVYYCVASNENGVVRSNNATLKVAYMRDEFRTVPRDTNAILGKDVVLECSPPLGYPQPVVKWKKDGDSLDLTSSKRIKIDANGYLVIKSVSKKDQGRYQCAAGNMANTRISKPVRLLVNEPPYFLTAPKDVDVMAGDDVFIECQVNGDPHPDVTWTKDNGDIDISKVKIVGGKGLRIPNVHPSDQGRYICMAKNVVGVVSASSSLTVMVPPVISVRPPTNVQVPLSKDSSHSVKLDCLVTGNPEPFVFWSKEGRRDRIYLPRKDDDEDEGIVITDEGSLLIENPDPKHSGHYACFAVNDVGSALARSRLLIYDPDDFTESRNLESYHLHSDPELDEARIATLEQGIRIEEISAVSSTSLKIKWNVIDSRINRFLEGFLIRYRSKSSRNVITVPVTHSGVSSFVITNLRQHEEYEVFVQPFYKQIVGRPASSKRIITHPDLPSEAPIIKVARLLNSSTIFLSWDRLSKDHLNGPFHGYEILIRGNGTSVNNTVDTDTTEVTLLVNGMSPHKIYTIQIAAVNSVGHGPFSAALEISKAGIEPELRNTPRKVDHVTRTTWIIAVFAVLTFVLIFTSGIFFYKRKFFSSDKGFRRKSSDNGYLPADTSDEFFHNHHRRMPHECDKFRSNLWIDRRWNNADYEKASNSSEKKLLDGTSSSSSAPPTSVPPMTTGSDTEYAYVDKHNLSSFSGGSSDHRNNTESPEPYATTDIFKQNFIRANQFYDSAKGAAAMNCHYADPIYVSSSRQIYQPPTSSRFPYQSHSCDDLAPKSEESGKERKGKNRQNVNLMEILPPPPTHPPPPPISSLSSSASSSSSNSGSSRQYNRSHESVISPKYLFHHPAYHHHQYSEQPNSTTPKNQRKKVRPVEKEIYHPPYRRIVLTGPNSLQNELECFNEAIKQFKNQEEEDQDSHHPNY